MEFVEVQVIVFRKKLIGVVDAAVNGVQVGTAVVKCFRLQDLGNVVSAEKNVNIWKLIKHIGKHFNGWRVLVG